MNQEFGVIGLAVMGRNLALNVESRGIPVAVYNRTTEKMEEFVREHGEGRQLAGYAELDDFVAALTRPRRILLMVKAGRAVDGVIEDLAPLLDKGDILIDGGNSHYADTERRATNLAKSGLNFFGMGVSGGEEGALKGPSLMPGGNREAYDRLLPVLEKIAAHSDSGPCVTYCGARGAGHFVKMVHNGIEYADMQLIAEAYDLMRNALGLDGSGMEKSFRAWNETELSSFLIEITADIVNFADPSGDGLLVDKILDSARQKGTGKWTTEAALDFGVPVPAITAAVDARLMSARKPERVRAASKLGAAAGHPDLSDSEKREYLDTIRDALYAAKIIAYAQGFDLIRTASLEMEFGTDLKEVARIWKAGCIIRARLLDDIRRAFGSAPDQESLLLDDFFAGEIERSIQGLRDCVALGVNLGLGLPAMSASLAYFDSFRRERLPANLTQAQRDYFGAHTYERTDRKGSFHTDWQSGIETPA